MFRRHKLQTNTATLSFREALLPKRKPGAWAYAIWFFSLLFALFQFFIQLSGGEIIGGLMQSFHLTSFSASILAGSSYYIYVLLQTPAGLLMDRYGPRKLLTLGALVLMLGCFLFAWSPHFGWAFLGRLIMGLGSAFAFVGNLYLVDKWFSRKHFAFFAGIMEMAAMLGALLGAFGLAHYVGIWGWRICMYVAAAFSGVLSLILGLVIRDMPPYRLALKPVHYTRHRLLPGILVLIRMKEAWINGIYSTIMFSLISVFAALWGIPYLQKTQGLSLVQATMYCSLAYVGTAVGSLLLGWLDTRIKHRRYVMSAFAIIGCFTITLVILIPSLGLFELSLCMLVMGLVASSYVLTFAVANEIAPLRIRSASIGFVNTISMGGTPLLQPMVGLILLLFAKSHHPVASQNTLHEFQLALMVVPFFLLLAVWLGWLIPSRRQM